jgi:formylglycine-generating enzyme required for sulfatase activity
MDHPGGFLPKLILMVVLASGCLCSPAYADKRVALVIGNAAYAHVARLGNPGNDARLMAATLRGLGFTLVGGGPQLDLDKSAIDRVVQDFGRSLQGADVGLFYFAGHGLQVDGINYLVPVDADPTKKADLDFQMLDAAAVIRQMNGAKLSLVLLDACRNNPFADRGMRDASPGLAQMRAPENTLISFATQPGNVTQDGADGNSPYAKALAAAIARKPALGLFDTFNNVGLAVHRATGSNQQPWMSNSPIESSFYFTEPPAPPTAADEIGWNFIRTTNDIVLLRRFAEENPTSGRRLEALARIAMLESPAEEARRMTDEGNEERRKLAAAAPPVPPVVAARPAPAEPAVAVRPVVPPAASGPCGGGAATVSLFSRSLSRSATPMSSGEECALKPEDSFRECRQCPEMVVVPAGSFTMGSPVGEKERDKNEGPQHTVTIGKPFAVGKFHVRVDQFAAFAAETGYDAGSKCWTFEGGKYEERSDRSWRNPGFTQGGSHPAVCVNWNDAKAYVAWLARKTGNTYRLLTEAEWEYAARARTEPGAYPRYLFGNEEKDLCRYGNGADQTAKSSIAGAKDWTVAPCNDGYAYTSPVGSFAANGFGLYDMQGNAWQWTQDCYHDSYTGAPSDGGAWTAGDCGRGVIRGGAWSDYPVFLRSANRIWCTTDFRFYDLGFRVARTLTP